MKTDNSLVFEVRVEIPDGLPLSSFESGFYGGRVGNSISSFLEGKIPKNTYVKIGYGNVKISVKAKKTEEGNKK